MTRRSIRLCGQEIDQPGHICAFFTSRDEEYDTLIPYMRDGVEAGEQVLTVLDAARIPEHRARLEAAMLSTTDGRVSISTSEETYLAGGYFDMARMVGFVHDHLADAAAKGQCVRTVGWMDWMHRDAPGNERTMEYEANMNLLVPTFDCTFMCVYDLAKLRRRDGGRHHVHTSVRHTQRAGPRELVLHPPRGVSQGNPARAEAVAAAGNCVAAAAAETAAGGRVVASAIEQVRFAALGELRCLPVPFLE